MEWRQLATGQWGHCAPRTSTKATNTHSRRTNHDCYYHFVFFIFCSDEGERKKLAVEVVDKFIARSVDHRWPCSTWMECNKMSMCWGYVGRVGNIYCCESYIEKWQLRIDAFVLSYMCRPHMSGTVWFCRRHRYHCLIQPKQRLANLIKNYSFCVSFCVRSNCARCQWSSLSIRNYIFEWHFVCRSSDGFDDGRLCVIYTQWADDLCNHILAQVTNGLTQNVFGNQLADSSAERNENGTEGKILKNK